jgi:hypothetical protein
MTQRLTLRLDQALHMCLQTEARLRHTTLSALGRQAIQTFVMQAGSAAGQLSDVAESSAAAPRDAWELLLTRCPPEVQAMVRRLIDRTGLPVVDVLRSLVIAAVTGSADIPTRPGASLVVPASSLVNGERTGGKIWYESSITT